MKGLVEGYIEGSWGKSWISEGTFLAQATAAGSGRVAVCEPCSRREGEADRRGDAPVHSAQHEPRWL